MLKSKPHIAGHFCASPSKDFWNPIHIKKRLQPLVDHYANQDDQRQHKGMIIGVPNRVLTELNRKIKSKWNKNEENVC